MKKVIEYATVVLCLAIFNVQLPTALAQGTAFTYQGRLGNGGLPASGSYDLLFSVYNVSSNGFVFAGPLTNNATAVSNGLFTVSLDFGPGVFTGQPCWLDISVRTNGGGAFTELVPRQAILPTPYAIMANSASNLLGTLSATQLTGTIPAGQISGAIASSNISGTYSGPVSFNNGQNEFSGDFFGSFFGSTFQGGIFTGQFVGDGSGLININPAHISGQIAFLNSNQVFTAQNVFMQPVGFGQPNPSPFYQIDALGSQANGRFTTTNNSNGSVLELLNLLAVPNENLGAINFNNAGSSYPGQIAYVQANPTNENLDYFQFRVGGSPGFQIQADPRGTLAANIVGGYPGNSISTIGSGSDVIAGGGYPGAPNTIYSNSDGVFIGAGSLNQVGPNVLDCVIAGGYGNTISGGRSVIGGGYFNTIQNDFYWGHAYGVVGGGDGNIIESNSAWSVIAGGVNNQVNSYGLGSVIGGGYLNSITGSSNYWANFDLYAGTIAGGANNSIQTNAGYSTIGGGIANSIQENSDHGTISGGSQNTIETNSAYSFIGGGSGNAIQPFSDHATIAGGFNNQIGTNAYDSSISGGYGNVMQAFAEYSAIGGGNENTNGGFYSFIGSGDFNWIQAAGQDSIIGGGYNNQIFPNHFGDVIAGGIANSIFANVAGGTIGGGNFNQVGASGGTVPGGLGNLAGGIQSFAAGTDAQATNNGAFVLADDELTNFYSTTSNQFSARFTGGVRFVTGGAGMTLDGQPILSAASGAPASGSASYIQNQAAGVQIASFQISGSASVGGGFSAGAVAAPSISSSNITASGTIAANSMVVSNNLQINGGEFQVLGAGSNTMTAAFIQFSTAANVSGDHTIINNPLCNGDPNAILIVTHNFNPGANGSQITWNHVIGTFYTGGQWTIYNEDLTTMQSNVAFNVLVIKH